MKLFIITLSICIIFSTASYAHQRLIVPFAPGGTTDITARAIAQAMRNRSPQVLVENRPGAHLNNALRHVMSHPPSGNVMFMGNSGMLAFDHYTDNTASTANPLNHLRVVALIVESPMLLMSAPTFRQMTPQEFIHHIKVNHTQIHYGVNGRGSSLQMAADLFNNRLGVSVQGVFYTGAVPALADLSAGRISYMFDSTVVGMMHHNSGRAVTMAVTSSFRSRMAPHVPTLQELGVPITFTVWQGIFVRHDTPDPIVYDLNQQIRTSLRDPEIGQLFLNMGVERILDLGVSESETQIIQDQQTVNNAFRNQ